MKSVAPITTHGVMFILSTAFTSLPFLLLSEKYIFGMVLKKMCGEGEPGGKPQQYLFAIGGWKPEGHKPIKAGSKKK